MDGSWLRRFETGRLVRVGFNHRYHPALQQARTLVDTGALGPLMFLRAGTGTAAAWATTASGAPIPRKSGGGELIDQGVHLIDLSRWFLGDFSSVDGIRRHVLLGHAGRR